MAIVSSASVVDFSAPKLQFELERPLDEADKVKLHVSNWNVTQWDKFYFIRPQFTTTNPSEIISVARIAASFNTAGQTGIGPVIPVILDLGTTAYSLYTPVQFARVQLRRYASDWRLILSEHYASKGQVAYVLEEKNPRCSAVIVEGPLPTWCWRQPAPWLSDSKAEYPHHLCNQHKAERDTLFRKSRTRGK